MSNSRCSNSVRLSVLLPLTLVLTACGINNITTYNEAVNSRWSELQQQYTRRLELVPDLLDTLQGMPGQLPEQLPEQLPREVREDAVFDEVTAARATVSQMNISPQILTDTDTFRRFWRNQQALGAALLRLDAFATEKLQLQSNEELKALQRQLKDTENRITAARRNFNLAARQYNTELKAIPGRWWASFMHQDPQTKVNF